ncbi:hypothetical protein AV650_28540 (plasmid) [Serratia fonticola]|nr:hypothetical protein AV650_28540 [Serratia fonticola]
MLTAGGQDIAFKGQRYIAQNTSALGDISIPPILHGAGGGWQVNLSSLGLSGQSGHLVAYLTSDVLAGGAEESDRLYRFKVNGRPDLNKMHTAIDMGANDVNNANNITANGDIRSNSGWLITSMVKVGSMKTTAVGFIWMTTTG